MTDGPYHPIDCAVHDRLEAWVVRRVPVTVRWCDAAGAEKRDRSVIRDLQVRDGAEYAVLASGQRIRLDRILEIAPE